MPRWLQSPAEVREGTLLIHEFRARHLEVVFSFRRVYLGIGYREMKVNASLSFLFLCIFFLQEWLFIVFNALQTLRGS